MDRAELRAALEHRVEDWRQVLRKYPQQGRQVLRALVGQIWLWVGSAEDLAIYEGAREDDDRGTENIDASDCGWVASVSVPGLVIGLPGFPGLDQRLASHSITSWNQILSSLRTLDLLRKTVNTAA